MDSTTYFGFIKFVAKFFAFSMDEFFSSLFIEKFLKKAKDLLSDIDASMFIKGTAGVCAQAMDTNGELLIDFNMIREKNQRDGLNAPSPGATATFAIADYIIDNC